ncbi:tryptophan-rich sensory protein [Candidatus Peregrinibacteria bacterium]|nr:tryptophan-rich sensory protein [Candidatus Peregrinibacteria bacterium]
MNFFRLLVSISIPIYVGLLGSMASLNAIPNWYDNLNKPIFTPPNWLFGPVWTILYTLMGISVYLVWNSKHQDLRKSLAIFWIHLVFNGIWSPIFFGLKNPELALLNIIIILIFIIILIYRFWKINKTASLLLFPYLIWVMYATALNAAIVIMN